MKYCLSFLFLAFTLIFTNCAGSGAASSNNTSRGGTEVIIDNPNLGLDVYLRRLSGVRVRGSGQNSSVTVRGATASTIQSDPRPLFVIDGVRAGRSFSGVYTMIDMNNVNSVSVVKLSRATILYGHEGSNGVIEISLKDG